MHGVKKSTCSEQQEKEPEELPKEWRGKQQQQQKKNCAFLISYLILTWWNCNLCPIA